MAEDPQPMTLQQRIAALNQAHVGRIPGEPPLSTLRPTPQIPTRRPAIVKSKTINNPPERINGSVTDIGIGNQPAGPPPLPTRKIPPPLPKRKISEQESRRGSEDSTKSYGTSETDSSKTSLSRSTSNESASRVKAPAWGECQLPEIPTRGTGPVSRKFSNEKPKYVNRVPAVITVVSAETTPHSTFVLPQRPIPPKLPQRKSQAHLEVVSDTVKESNRSVSSIQKLDKLKDSAISLGLNKSTPLTETALDLNAPVEVQSRATTAPPIPLSSRPDLSAIQSTKPKFSNRTSSVNGSTNVNSSVCLVCRDFSSPDHQATLFPRSQVTSLQDLAIQLTSPFVSQTDKARAIFTWLHHNIAYDVVNFSRGTVKPSTPQSTLQSGLAVCEGYAALFTTLATHAGLESVVITGHGKGYGYAHLAPGSSIPPYESNHAWNAVKIDNGEWKLIDCCWGAGYGQGTPLTYCKRFDPDLFSMPNEEFGVKHFPGNKEHFFLSHGRQMRWEEYIQINPALWPDMVEPPTVFSDAKKEFGIGEKSVLPRSRHIRVGQGGTIRFQFGLLCPHWTFERHQKNGPPLVFLISNFGSEDRERNHIPMNSVRGVTDHQGGGDIWYLDIPVRELGQPGQTVTLCSVKTFGDRKDARGLTVKEFLDGRGRVGMSFIGIASWELV